METLPQPRILVEGLTLPECPRWHQGALYFSDIAAGRVFRLNERDEAELLFQADGDFTGGLGFLDDGSLITVLSKQRRLHRIAADGGATYADLSGLCAFVLNDMVITGNHAFVSQPGFDIWKEHATGMPPATDILHVSPSGKAGVAAADVMSPNGMAVSPDGRTLYVSECTAMRIACFDIDPEAGTLSNRRIFGRLPDGGIPDGICIDDTGAVWAASPVAVTGAGIVSGRGVVRLIEGGEVTHVVPVGEGRRALACAFGGSDRRTLYICTVPDFDGSAASSDAQGRLEAVTLDFTGAGRP